VNLLGRMLAFLSPFHVVTNQIKADSQSKDKRELSSDDWEYRAYRSKFHNPFSRKHHKKRLVKRKKLVEKEKVFKFKYKQYDGTHDSHIKVDDDLLGKVIKRDIPEYEEINVKDDFEWRQKSFSEFLEELEGKGKVKSVYIEGITFDKNHGEGFRYELFKNGEKFEILAGSHSVGYFTKKKHGKFKTDQEVSPDGSDNLKVVLYNKVGKDATDRVYYDLCHGAKIKIKVEYNYYK